MNPDLQPSNYTIISGIIKAYFASKKTEKP